MKHRLIAIAVNASLLAPTMAFADSPKVYGRIDVSVDNISVDSDAGENSASNAELNSHGSRLGVKGKKKLSDQLTAIYKAEWEVSVDGDGESLKQRSRYVGLQGAFGTVTAGMIDTPLK